ncbi:hypothetical protein GCM10028857_21970 [Salinarchaeum chitinilyticum]
MRRNTPLPAFDARANRPDPTLRGTLGAALLPVAFVALLAVPELVLAGVIGAVAVPAWRRIRSGIERLASRRAPVAVTDSPTASR